ncbi:hypothetical protein BC835DRAFT_1400998, partial [Cytidiella melzeri]
MLGAATVVSTMLYVITTFSSISVCDGAFITRELDRSVTMSHIKFRVVCNFLSCAERPLMFCPYTLLCKNRSTMTLFSASFL